MNTNKKNQILLNTFSNNVYFIRQIISDDWVYKYKFQAAKTDHITGNPNLNPLNITWTIVNCNNNKEINLTEK